MKSRCGSRLASVFPFGIAAVIFAVSLFLVSVQRNIQEERLTVETRNVGAVFAARLETHLATRLNAGKLLGQKFLRNDNIDVDVFRAETLFLHELFGDFQALNWVDANGVIQIITPEEGNSAALGLDLRQLPVPSATLARAEESGKMQITPPIALAQGGVGFVAYIPIKGHDEENGFINIVFRAAAMMKNALGADSRRSYDIEIRDSDTLLFSSGDTATLGTLVEELTISVGDRDWQLQVAPTPARVREASTLIDETILIVGSFFAALIGVLTRLIMVRQISIQESQARFRDFASASSDWFWEMDENLTLTWFSQGIEEFFGVPRERFLGRTRGDFRDPVDDDEEWEKHFADLNARRPFRDFTYAIKVRGERKWVRVSGVPRFDPEGTFLGYRGTAANMTELVLSRDAVVRANERLADAVESLNDVFSLWDEEDRLVFGNRVFRELGKDVPEVLEPGTPFETYLRAGIEIGQMRELTGREEEFLAHSLARRLDPRAKAFEIERADGVILRLHEQKLEGGGIVTIGQDVTKQRKSEEALRASQERLALAAQRLTIWDCKCDAGELYLSPGFAELLGYSQEEFEDIKYTKVASIIRPGDPDEDHAGAHGKPVERPTTFSNEHCIKTKSGDRKWFIAHGQCTIDDGRVLRSTGALLDITERVELENKLNLAQKMEAIGSLTGGMAHDFNNLLAVIMGNLELLRDDVTSEEQRELIDAGLGATERGANLVKSMLSFARRAGLKPELLDLNDLVRAAKAWIGRMVPANIDFELSQAEGLRYIEADPGATENAILNLILNSRDAMPDGGKLTLKTANIRIDNEHIDDLDEDIEPGRYVMLAVSDSGHGIPGDVMGKVFEPFYTTKPPGCGSGMGLSMVQGFVKQSGGAIRVNSEPGVGTTIKLYFKAVSGQADKPVRVASLAFDRIETGKKILVVEDEPAVLSVLVSGLEKAGYMVTSARTGDEAGDIFNSDPTFDVLLTDIVMPETLQGTDLARALRKINPDLPVVIMSGYAREAAVHGNGLHPDDVRLMKPVRMTDLVKALKRVLG